MKKISLKDNKFNEATGVARSSRSKEVLAGHSYPYKQPKKPTKSELVQGQKERLKNIADFDLDQHIRRLKEVRGSTNYSFVGSLKKKEGPRRQRVTECIGMLLDVKDTIDSIDTANPNLNRIKGDLQNYLIENCICYLSSPALTQKTKEELGTEEAIRIDLKEPTIGSLVNENTELPNAGLTESLMKKASENEKFMAKIQNKLPKKKSAKKSAKKKTTKKVAKKKVAKKTSKKKGKTNARRKTVS